LTSDDDLSFAHALADAADAVTTARFRALDLRVDTKPDLTPVSEADRRAEEVIRELIGGSGREEGVLAEGLSTELGTQLAHIRGLRIIARTTALRAGTDHLEPAQLAQRVGVTHVLSGELRELGGDQVRLELQLLDAPAGRTLWSHSYEQKLAGVTVLEREVAQAIAAQLRMPVLPFPSGTPAKRAWRSRASTFWVARRGGRSL